MRIYEYLDKGIRGFTFLIGHRFESFATVKGRKRVNLRKLFLKTELRERNLNDLYEMPDKEYVIYMTIPPNKFKDASKKKRI